MNNRTCYPGWDSACREPRKVDWLALAVWASMPFVSAAFYYGIWRWCL